MVGANHHHRKVAPRGHATSLPHAWEGLPCVREATIHVRGGPATYLDVAALHNTIMGLAKAE